MLEATKPLAPETVVAVVRAATRTLFDTMIGGVAEELPEYRTSTVVEDEESIFCLIGFSGQMVGSGSLHCSRKCALQLASALLLTPYEEVDAEVLDAVAEITNMIVGNFKTAMEDDYGVLGISTPTVIYGQRYAARNFGSCEWVVVPFRYEEQDFDIRISLQPDRTLQKQIERFLKHQNTPETHQ